jgi:YrbI family 3-deoxy-D-manno-octulosonate 8-phosphate phosphatase
MTNILLVDCDGVLSNGQVYVTHKGERFKAFNSRDNRALAEFVAAGWQVHIVSASGWPGVEEFVKNTGVEVHLDNQKTREDILKITEGNPFYAVGDDVFDLTMMEMAQRAFCPADADYQVVIKHWVDILSTNGGQGVVAELARTFLRKPGN